jgi:hypothetical protein
VQKTIPAVHACHPRFPRLRWLRPSSGYIVSVWGGSRSCGDERIDPRYSPIFRGGPISTGWSNTATASVHTSESASSLHMLDVPGWLESHTLPNAVAVVAALKITARGEARLQKPGLPGAGGYGLEVAKAS